MWSASFSPTFAGVKRPQRPYRWGRRRHGGAVSTGCSGHSADTASSSYRSSCEMAFKSVVSQDVV
jgi:hypothetical protein